MSTKPADQQLRVRYEQTQALYASQFVLNASEEEIIINFSSGSLPDPQTGETHLPIHSRVALSTEGARRLLNLLNQALSATQQQATSTSAAKLPPLKP
ncbi:MAG: DUF3467 domain-containing protein [Thiotrichaceae bacterium]|nr:DUF3467 domain-containing protein [Thiotrichaceae bacterium]